MDPSGFRLFGSELKLHAATFIQAAVGSHSHCRREKRRKKQRDEQKDK
ncbi:hypothetical protein GQ55_3G484200 [Panicum hallii var. hallii]|uniref:Uncharacterized protein n=2 Tax=Panicum hallii TaxID=206008 RepID=A0A2T7EJN9_9POAL|nr:hypothetical protein PAHAL_3G511200 [Panicum hallii]PUZ68057.1 hypothetical protein GQ55_3G484200 [Panicum hallii var. hallii]